MRPQSFPASLALAIMVVSCAPSGQERQAAQQLDNPAVQNRTLTVSHRYEPTNLAPKVLQTNGTFNTARLFNAALSLIDEAGVARPYLAESLPQLNTDAWQVFPDGSMETRYVLAPGITWHDGVLLTADDFAFAFRVYKESGLQTFITAPLDTIETVQAPDPRTVVIRWLVSNPQAGSITFEDLDPLPQHILGRSHADMISGRSTAEAFMADSAWTGSYIGAGPYRLERWDPGVHLEGTAFSGHILGAARIQRVVVRVFVDENQTLGVIMTGGIIDYACCNTLRFPQLVTLKQEWEASGKGIATAGRGNGVWLNLQLRPAYVGHEALLDLRVRRALAHAVDRGAINEGAFNGLGHPTESPIPPDLPYFQEAERLGTKYPLDLARATELMGQAGFTRDGSGLFADRQGRRFHIDFTVQSGSDIEKMQTILSDSWRQAGFEARPQVMAPQLFAQLETRHTVPGLGYSLFGGELSFTSSEIGTEANRWRGRNRTGWSTPEYDRLYEAWHGELDPGRRGGYVARMMAIVSENVPGYALYFPPTVTVWVNSLKGPTGREASRFGETSRPTTAYPDVHTWFFQ